MKVFSLGSRVINRGDQRQASLVVAPGHGVDIGDQGVAQSQGAAGCLIRGRTTAPGTALVEGVVGTVQAQDRAENAILHPTGVELIIFDTTHMAADIVAPPAVADVGRSGGESGLEIERLPADDGVTGETDRVAVTAQSTPAREDEGSFEPIPSQVIEMQVVEPAERVQSGQAGKFALLPVDPPEIDALLFIGMVQNFEIALRKPGVSNIEGDWIAAVWVNRP